MKTYTAARLTDYMNVAQYEAASAQERLSWARNWVRFLLRDIPNEAGVFPANGLEDEEIDAVLAYAGITENAITYYLPHVTAANLLESDPARWLSLAVSGYSETRRNPVDLAAHIRRAYGPLLEVVIPEHLRPGSGQFAITF
jgi:hypothetical protein